MIPLKITIPLLYSLYNFTNCGIQLKLNVVLGTFGRILPLFDLSNGIAFTFKNLRQPTAERLSTKWYIWQHSSGLQVLNHHKPPCPGHAVAWLETNAALSD